MLLQLHLVVVPFSLEIEAHHVHKTDMFHETHDLDSYCALVMVGWNSTVGWIKAGNEWAKESGVELDGGGEGGVTISGSWAGCPICACVDSEKARSLSFDC